MSDADHPRPFELFRKAPGYGLYIGAIFLNGLAVQIQTVAIGWQVYDMTRDPFDLGLVGLSQFLPAILLVLVTGSVADRFSRRTIITTCLLLEAIVAAGLVWLTATGNQDVRLIFGLLVVFGLARAFYIPARQSLLVNIVPAKYLPGALAFNGSVNQFATVCGPLAGGLLYAVMPSVPYTVALVSFASGAIMVRLIAKPPQRTSNSARSWSEMTAGVRYIWTNRLILGAISLDLFVVLLGGAYALLPVYARDVLEVGPWGLGLLRAAPAMGAVIMALWLFRRPVRKNAGRIMFATVGVFCAATFVFSVSTLVWLSVVALVIVGASDIISVIIRNTIVQLHTPDQLRGRVNAVGQVFTGASNELGGFRAGTMAAFFGPVLSVAGGAVMAMGICALWTGLFPQLRKVSSLSPSDKADTDVAGPPSSKWSRKAPSVR